MVTIVIISLLPQFRKPTGCDIDLKLGIGGCPVNMEDVAEAFLWFGQFLRMELWIRSFKVMEEWGIFVRL